MAGSTTDANGNITSITWNDPDFWRPAQITDPMSRVTTFSYGQQNITGQNGMFYSEAYLNFDNSTATMDVKTGLDGFGRTLLTERRQAPGSSALDAVETDYGSSQFPRTQTMPYLASGMAFAPSGTPTSTTYYDALNRVSEVDDSGSPHGSVTYSYYDNDVLVTIGPAPTGENTKQRQYEYDILGRLKSVCEITAGTTAWPGTSCAQTNGQTGYWTTYTRTYGANPGGVNQQELYVKQYDDSNGKYESRSFFYDQLGRLSAEINPENGTTQYFYDSASTCSSNSYNGDLVERKDNAGNVTCYAYDNLHRLTDVTYPSGPNSAGTQTRHYFYDTTVIDSVVPLSNTKGRLSHAITCTSGVGCPSGWTTDEGFSYDADGGLTDVYEATPHSPSGEYYHLNAVYWANGNVNQLSAPAPAQGQPTNLLYNLIPTLAWTALDGEGRPTQVTATTGQQPVTSASWSDADPSTSPYVPLGALTNVTYGSGDSDQPWYDMNTGRMKAYNFVVNTYTDQGQLTWNANGSVSALTVSDPFNANDIGCSYTHDDLARIATANCGTAWNQSFAYDPFGNIAKTGSNGGISFIPASYSNNQINLTGFSYDSDGNLKNWGDSSHTASWDAEGRLVSISNGTTTVNAFTYDALGRAVEHSYGTNSYEQIVYSPDGNKFALMTGGTTLSKAFVPLPGGGTAVYNSSGLAYYMHSDWLGSSRLASAPTGTNRVLYDGAYAPFGESYAETSSYAYRSFTGENEDTVQGLADFLFREYSDQQQGRWMSPDPAGLGAADVTNPQSWNRYAYVLNNPLPLIDPLGLDCGDALSAIADSSGCPSESFLTASGGGAGQDAFAEALAAYLLQTNSLMNGWSGYNNLGCLANSGTVTCSAGGEAIATFTYGQLGLGSPDRLAQRFRDFANAFQFDKSANKPYCLETFNSNVVDQAEGGVAQAYDKACLKHLPHLSKHKP